MRPNIPTMLQTDYFETSHADLLLAAVIGEAPKPVGKMENDDLIKFVNLSGPGIDALEARKETNNHHKVTAEELRDSFEKVKNDLFSGLAALLRT